MVQIANPSTSRQVNRNTKSAIFARQDRRQRALTLRKRVFTLGLILPVGGVGWGGLFGVSVAPNAAVSADLVCLDVCKRLVSHSKVSI